MLSSFRTRFLRLQDHMTVAQQMSVALALVSLVGIGALAVLSAGLSRSEMIRRIITDITLSARLVVEEINSELSERDDDIRQLATMVPLTQVWLTAPGEARATLNTLQETLPIYAWIGFASLDGTVMAATHGLLEGSSVSARPWFREGLKGPFAGDVHEAVLLAGLLGPSATGEPMRFVDIAYPVHGPDGALIGVLGAHLGFSWANDLLRGAHLGSQDKEIWLLDKEGRILIGPKAPHLPFPPQELALIQREKSGVFEDHREGANVLTAFAVSQGERRFPGLGWIVIARQDASMAFAVPTRVGSTILLLGVVVLALSIVASILVARRLSGPVTALALAAGEIGRDPGATMLPRVRGSVEVVRLSGSLRALLRRLGSVELRFMQHERRYQEDLAALRQLADSDPLTGLMNRRSFLSVAEDALAGMRSSDTLAILVADIDHFKAVNDTYGHAAGDAAIRHVGAQMAALVRAQDRVARFGGEEFIVLLRDLDRTAAQAVAERIRGVIAAQRVDFEGHPFQVTVSIGLARASASDRDVDAVIERADLALYAAKSGGRNRVVEAAARE